MIVIEKYGSLDEANHLLNGSILGGEVKSEYIGLVGATITFTSPADSCTFTQPAGRVEGVLLFKDVKEQLETAIPNIRVESINGKLGIRHTTGGTEITLASANEPARAILGFPNQKAIAGRAVDGTSVKLVGPVQIYDGMVHATLEIT